jgi:hypothetical protein
VRPSGNQANARTTDYTNNADQKIIVDFLLIRAIRVIRGLMEFVLSCEIPTQTAKFYHKIGENRLPTLEEFGAITAALGSASPKGPFFHGGTTNVQNCDAASGPADYAAGHSNPQDSAREDCHAGL